MSDDPSDSNENKPSQGRWLGAVRSWIGGSAESGDGGAAAGGGDREGAAAESSPTLSAEEIRRRRLEKMEGSMSVQPQRKEQKQQPETTRSPTPMDVTPEERPSDSHPPSSATPTTATTALANATTSATPSVVVPRGEAVARPPPENEAMPDLEPKPGRSFADGKGAMPDLDSVAGVSIAARKRAATAVAGVRGGGGAGKSGVVTSLKAGGSTGGKITPELRVHNSLRTVLMVTATQGDLAAGLTYVGDAMDGDTLLKEENLPEVVCARLAAPDLKDRGIGYLARAFGRCHEELQSVRRREGKADVSLALKALEVARTQLVSFSATCLMEPGIFDEPQGDSPDILVAMLSSEDQGPESVQTGFLTPLLAELDTQGGLADVLGVLMSKIISKLTECKTASDPWLPPCMAITKLMQSSKKACELLVKLPRFFLPKAGTPEAAPIPAPAPARPAALQMMMMRHGHQALTIDPRSGAFAANGTILGKIFRLGYPVNDALVGEVFTGAYKRGQVEVDNRVQMINKRLKTVHSVACGIMMTLVKGSVESRKAVVGWFADTLLVNDSAEAYQPDPTKTASPEFLMNVGVALLYLAMPIDESKFSKIDASSFLSSQAAVRNLFPEDTTMLIAKDEGATAGRDGEAAGGERKEAGGDGTGFATEERKAEGVAFAELKSFTTQAFFVCWRGLHLGLVQVMGRHKRLHQNLAHVQRMMGGPGNPNPDSMVERQFNLLFTRKMAAEVVILDSEILSDSLLFMVRAGSWLTEFVAKEAGVPIDSSEHESGAQGVGGLPQGSLVWQLPEHLIDDILELILFLTRFHPSTLGKTQLYPLMTMVVFFLAHPSLVRSPHLRAKLGDVLYTAFLPPSHREEENYNGTPLALGGAHTGLLYSHPLAQQHLAPSLLLLYGDVEHTGFYEKLTHRFYIAAVLKYLWSSKEHRSTFRRISQDTNKFVRFANGLMNESNSLVASVMEKLPEVRTVQLQMRDPAQWGAMTEAQRNEVEERHQSNERELKSNLSLCNETLNMVAYLTSDQDIQKPFLRDELLPRLAEMLLCVLKQLIGSKGLEIKVDNPESYNFRPKDMLREICTTISQFSTQAGFQKALATSGYYQEDLLPKATATMRRLQLLPAPVLGDMDLLCKAVVEARVSYDAAEASLGEVPEDFLDPVLFHVMRDPVLLPTSGTVVDRSTIVQHLLNDSNDPFNRQPLTEAMLEPQPELRRRIEEFIAKGSGTAPTPPATNA